VVADHIRPTNKNPFFALLAGFPFTVFLHLMVELNVLLIVDFVVTEVVVVE